MRYAVRIVPRGAPSWASTGRTLATFSTIAAAAGSPSYCEQSHATRIVAVDHLSFTGFRQLSRDERCELDRCLWRRLDPRPPHQEAA